MIFNRHNITTQQNTHHIRKTVQRSESPALTDHSHTDLILVIEPATQALEENMIDIYISKAGINTSGKMFNNDKNDQ